MAAEPFPPIPLRLIYERNGAAGQALLADIEDATGRAEARFREFSATAQQQIDIALGSSRNSSGSLDLNVAGLQAAAKAQEARAIAAREVAQATAIAAREEGDYSQSARLAAAATEALAREEEQAARAARSHAEAAEQVQRVLNRQASATQDVVNSLNAGTTANRSLINSQSALRQATVQAGQQLQDIGISLYSGQRATVVFAQQLPQLAFALTGLEGSANKAQDRIGRFATFLSGPWGLAVGLAAGAVVGLIGDVLGLGEASEKSSKSTLSLADALDASRFATEEGRKAIADYNEQQEKQRDSAERMIKINLASAESDVRAAQAKRERLRADLEYFEQAARQGAQSESGDVARAGAFARADRLRDAIAAQEGEIAKLDQLVRNLRIEDAKREAEGAVDPIRRITNQYEDLAEAAIAAAKGNDALSKSLKGTLADLERRKASDIEAARSAQRAERRVTRDPGELTRFISPVAGGRITGQFGEQRGDRRHAGIDIAVPVGTPVRAPAGGIIIESGTVPGYGNVVVIDHGGGTITRLAHLSRLGLQEGATVAQGDVVGLSGGARGAPGSGNSRGPHLHQETRVNGRAVDPRTGRFRTDAFAIADRAQDAAEKALERQNAQADALLGKLAQVNARFADQPRLVTQAELATADLDAVIADMAEKLKDPNLDPQLAEKFAQAKAEAESAKGAIEDALVRPIRELAEESARRIQIDTLLLAGREREARVLETIWQIERDRGPLTAAQRADVEAIVSAEERHLEVLRKLQDQQSIYLSATRSVRSELENLFAGEKVDFGRLARRIQAQATVELIFGDSLRQLDKAVQAKYDIGADAIKAEGQRVSTEFSNVADAASQLASALSTARTSPAAIGSSSFDETAWYDFLGEFDKALPGKPSAANDNDIVVTARRDADATARALEKSNTALGMTPEEYANMLGLSLVAPLLRGLPPAIAGPLGRILGGAAGGYATGGVAGGIFGALKGIDGLGAKVDKIFGRPDVLGGAVKGAATGTAVAGIGNALGIKLNNTGAQIGGAIGSFIPIPGGQIIGSIAGGLIGNLFGKRPRGAAAVTDSSLYASTNDSGLTKDISSFGSDIQGAVKRIAEAIGADVGAFDIGLGRYKEYYQVSSKANDPRLGNSFFGRDSANALYDGTDPAAAAAAALAEAIRDGAIKGLSATAERILKSTPDIDAAIQKILDFRSVFDRLRAIKDPVGAAMDELDKEFSRLRGIFESAGASAAEFAQLEELYGIERAKAIEEATQRVAGSLRSLLDDLTTGDNGLSLRDRRANALTQYDALATRVRAGDTTAFDEYAQKARDLLDIERQLFGSTSEYFKRFDEVRGISQGALDQQQALADAAAKRDSGLDAGIVRDSVNTQTQVLGDKLDAVNDNLIALGGILSSVGGESLAARFGLNTRLA